MELGDNVRPHLEGLIDLFLPSCTDRSTMGELKELLSNQDRWLEAHALFRRIRIKTLASIERGDKTLECQYCFEEICAKTMFNLTDTNAPFDLDSPFFVIPIAIRFARISRISDAEVVRVVCPI